MHEPRIYRRDLQIQRLTAFSVRVKETDLLIQARRDLTEQAREAVLEQRGFLEAYIRAHPRFQQSLTPWRDEGPTPAIVAEMIAAGLAAGVGPMAAVAGAIAQRVGRALLTLSDEVIVENGGDVFIAVGEALTVALYAGSSPLSMRVGLRIVPEAMPLAVCTSSGTVGQSLSLGRADAACVVAADCALADAAATAVANRVRSPADIAAAVNFGRTIEGVLGLVVVAQDKIGMWGRVEVVPLTGKKG
jgi:ApbE superfamily uncharacterized protein (UPF0280 family)